MIKVFLAEDEIVVREGIKSKINWEAEGMEFVGEASDGELAFPMIQKLQPDIVITDIKMPFVDGIELSRMIKADFPWIKIMILSGYGEFAYAKDAISIGVTDYLLKPITAEKLLESVKAVASSIEEEKEQKRLLEHFQKEQEEHLVIEKQKLFFDLVCKEMPMQDAIERARKVEIDLAACIYNIVLFKMMIPESNRMIYSEEVVKAEKAVIEVVEAHEKVELFFRDADGYALLFMTNSEEECAQVFESVLNKILFFIKKNGKLEYFFGVGKPVQRLRELQESFYEANRAFSYRYLGRKNDVVFYDKREKIVIIEEEKVDFGNLDAGKMDSSIIQNFLKSASLEETRPFIEDYFLGLGEENVKSLLFRQYIAMNVYFAVTSFLDDLGQAGGMLENPIDAEKEPENLFLKIENTKEYLQKILQSALAFRDTLAQKKFGDLITSAKLYIKENYQKEEISLNAVAASVNISPSYFSTVFSQETGRTFIEYLTAIRMEKAKELLMCTNKKTSDIGFEVGYKDAHYFSYLFRKTQQCSPKEFKMRGKDNG